MTKVTSSRKCLVSHQKSLQAVNFVLAVSLLANSLDQDQDLSDRMSVLIWIKTVCLSNSVLERKFKKGQQTTIKAWKNFPACIELIYGIGQDTRKRSEGQMCSLMAVYYVGLSALSTDLFWL